MSSFPGYTFSLLFWIIPDLIFIVLFHTKINLKKIQKKALYVNIFVLSIVGFILDLLFANKFFRFPNSKMTLGIDLNGIPIEEFIFYVTGFMFIILLYIFFDEYFLKKYNVDDKKYYKFAKKIKKKLYLNFKRSAVLLFVLMLIPAVVVKLLLNSSESYIPGYYIYLLIFAYIPYILFSRVTRMFMNWRAVVFTIVVTTLISIIWEVTLALPYGFWGYNPEYMIGIFIKCWHNLPIEAVTVWIFSSLITYSYEFTKIVFFNKMD